MTDRAIAKWVVAAMLTTIPCAQPHARASADGDALVSAAAAGDSGTVRSLIESGADLEVRSDSGHTPLHMAAASGHANVARVLIEAGAELEARRSVISGATPLHTAAAFGHAEVAKVLIEAGANLEARNIDGQTALIRAAQSGQANVVSLLLVSGAEVYFVALTESAAYGHTDVVRLLIGFVGVQMRNRDGQTLLHLAAAQLGTVNLTQLLIEAGVNLDARDAAGDTALHLAAKQGDADVVRVLIKAGANRQIKNAAGFTALRMAEHRGRVVIARSLRTK